MTHDKKWFVKALEEVCRKHFWVVEELEHFEESPVRKAKRADDDEEKSSENEEEKKEGEEEREEIDPKRRD